MNLCAWLIGHERRVTVSQPPGGTERRAEERSHLEMRYAAEEAYKLRQRVQRAGENTRAVASQISERASRVAPIEGLH